ncbi:MAG: hypothetical protein ABJE47_25495, partial [bacterium]
MEQSVVSPSASTLIVHAVLDANQRDQYIVLQGTNGLVSEQAEVPNALVTITDPDGRVMTAEEVRDDTLFATKGGQKRLSTAYHISLDRYNATLVPGATYTLRIVAPSGTVISGSTVIPAGAAIPPGTSTTEPFDFLHDTLTLSWPSVRYARSYQVNISSTFSLFTEFADSSVAIPGFAYHGGSEPFVPGLLNHVTVLAVDLNYYDYYRLNSEFFAGKGALTHLDGA